MNSAANWWREAEEVGTRRLRELSYSRWERLYYRLFRVWPQSVVDRRMEALISDEAEHRRWLRDNPYPRSESHV